MKNIIWVFIIVMHFCVVGNIWGQEKVIEALKTEKGGVTIDGNLDDPVWQVGEWETRFTIIGRPHKQARAQTFFKIAYDEDRLYFAAKIEEPYPSKLKIEEFKRDSSFHEDDAIELMIDPYGDQSEYYIFAANAVGTKFDEKRSLYGLLRELEWDAEWKVATKIGGREWTVEMAIPFAELGLTERSLKHWKLNVVRNRHTVQEKEYSSYAPLMSNFNEDRNFVSLKFSPEVFKKYLWNIKCPYEYFFEVDSGGVDWLKGKLYVENKGSADDNFKLVFKQLSKKSVNLMGFFDKKLGKTKQAVCEFWMPVEKQTPLKLRVELANPDNPQEILRVEKWTLYVDYDSLQLSFIEPNYRDMVYSTQNLSEIKFNVRFTLTPELLKDSTLRVQMLSPNEESDKEGNVVYGVLRKELLIEEVPVSETYTLPIEDLMFGNYLVRAELLNSNGKVIASKEKVIKKLKPVAYEWRVDADGNLRKNGAVVMPTGFFRMTVEELEKRKGEYSVIFQSRGNILDAVDANAYLDKLEKLGAYGVLYPYPNASFIASRVEGLGQSVLEKEKEAIQAHVKSLRKHPALMAWVLAFLGENESISAQRLKLIYDIVSDEDPFHPCVIVISSNRSIVEYSRIADILMPFTRLSFLKDDGTSRPLNLVSRQFDLINRLKKPGSMFWACLQAYDQPMSIEAMTRLPNIHECRSMLYQSLIKGSKGFFWYHFSEFKNFPEMEPIVQFLVQELKSLQDAIIAPNIPAEIKKEEDLPSSEMILSMLKKVGDDYYLFAVNLSGEKKEVHLNLPEVKSKKALSVISEGREVKLGDKGSFTDTFDAFEAHIYSTKPVGGPTLQDLKEKIKIAKANKKKSGNLAFIDSGVTISVSSSLVKKPNLNVLVDGTFEGLAWESNPQLGLPQWVALKWPNPIKANRVVIYTDTIEEAELQVKKDNDWVSVGAFKKMSIGHLEIQFEEKEFSELRIWITGKKPEAKSVSLGEIEVYDIRTAV